MENFIVSARKYRPATFDMVVGQDSITNTLKSAIKNNHLAQAYLFCGPRGVGKTTCARIFAKTINCDNLGENVEACDKCESCHSFNSMRSFNIHELDAASNNKVEDIRSLNEQVRIPPQVGKYSIYIIDEVHMLSASAFNAFLKTLEEPPSHAIFILATTEKHKIIPTILSRCQTFDFNRIRIDDIVGRLMYVAENEGIEASEEALHIIGQKADGAMRDALSIFDQIVSLTGKKIEYKDVIENLNVLDYEYYFKTVEAAANGDLSAALVILNEVLAKGFDGHNFISGLNSHFRDLLVSKDKSTVKLLEATPGIRQKYLQQSERCSIDFLFNALETGSNCDLSYKGSKNPRLHIELALIKLCMINSGKTSGSEKKKPDVKQQLSEQEEIPLPSKSEILREDINIIEKNHGESANIEVNHNPVIEKPAKTFSIKDMISGEFDRSKKTDEAIEKNADDGQSREKQEFEPASFEEAWKEFTGQLKDEGTRVVSMFNSIKPEFEDENTLKLHLSNADQRDLFVQNYKMRLIAFLKDRFVLPEFDIETHIDILETNGTLYTDDQKATYLFKKYPVLKDMKRTFNLDII
jgi:DNA polymerase-3 subunit gamma/tau